MNSSAIISPDRVYRYYLRRVWSNDFPLHLVNFVMLNPSTADATKDDATIRRCIGFAKAWGHDGIVVTNLFALRATDPKELRRHADPVGLGKNDGHIIEAATDASIIVCAWGGGAAWRSRGADVRKSLEYAGLELHHLGLTKKGHPKHPLYLPKTARPIEWRR